MPTTKVSEFLYGRLRSPDLDQAETFLTEFGMVRAARTRTALYMRGTDPMRHIHITELGEPRFFGARLRRERPGRSEPPGAAPGRLGH